MILATLVRVLPELHVRKRPIVTVIGCGDVVLQRIIPALQQVYEPGQIAVAADHISSEDDQRLAHLEIAEGNRYSLDISVGANQYPRGSNAFDPTKVKEKIVEWVASHSRFAILAVPTPFHLEYMLALHREGIRFAVEKPLVGTASELALIRQRTFAGIFEDSFVLSYYWLEKALPLNYLLTVNPAYRPLLDLMPEMRTSEMELLVSRLGRLRSIAVEFLEPPEPFERYWSELQENGGMVMETLVHPLTLVMNLARRSTDVDLSLGLWAAQPTTVWSRDQIRAAEIRGKLGLEIGATSVVLDGRLTNGAEIHIRCGKYMVTEASRFLVAAFDNGWITCDLSRMITRLLDIRQQLLLEITNKPVLKSQKRRVARQHPQHTRETQPFKYQQQVDLVNTFFADGWGGLRFDDYPGQLDVLKELVRIAQDSPAAEAVPEKVTDPERDSPLLTEAMMLHPATLTVPTPDEG